MTKNREKEKKEKRLEKKKELDHARIGRDKLWRGPEERHKKEQLLKLI